VKEETLIGDAFVVKKKVHELWDVQQRDKKRIVGRALHLL
jgi:hypothetical protein